MENVATFSFSDGSSIEIDRNCTISGMLKCGNFSDKMCPDISYRGKSISVNGEPQRNRRSKHNFAGTVEYVLTLFDDTKLTYKVMLTEEYPSIWLYTEGGKEIEAKKDKPVCFDTRMKIPIMFSDPEQPSAELKEEIIRYFADFENALLSSFFSDPMKGYRSFIDINSFISNYIIQELSKNIDADLFKSLFLVKRKGGKMEFYHVWDFDLAFGNCNYLNAHEAVSTGHEGWYCHIFNDPWFTAQLKTKWTTIYPQLKSLPEEIKSISRQIYGSAGRNFSKWQTLDRYVWPNVVWLGSYDKEVDYLLDFYSQRLEILVSGARLMRTVVYSRQDAQHVIL